MTFRLRARDTNGRVSALRDIGAGPRSGPSGISPWTKAEVFEARRKHHLDVLRIHGDETGVSEEGLLDVGSQSIIEIRKQTKEALVPVCFETSSFSEKADSYGARLSKARRARRQGLVRVSGKIAV